MKKLIIFFIIITNNLFSQSTPYFIKDSSGSEFVILSVEQARRLDNLTEGKCNSVIDSLTNLVKVRRSEFEEYQKVRTELYSQIKSLDEIIKVQGSQITLYDEKLNEVNKKNELYNEQIKVQKSKLKNEKTLRFILVGIATASFLAMVSILGL